MKKTTLKFTIGNFNELGIRIQLTGFEFDLNDKRNKYLAEMVVKIMGAELYAISCGISLDKECIIEMVDEINNFMEL